MEIPGNGGRYDIQHGRSVILFCNVTSITRPTTTWNKRTYQGYEIVQSQEFQAEFSSSGFGWSSAVYITQFNYTDSGNYSCSGATDSNYSIQYATLYIEGKQKLWSFAFFLFILSFIVSFPCVFFTFEFFFPCTLSSYFSILLERCSKHDATSKKT